MPIQLSNANTLTTSLGGTVIDTQDTVAVSSVTADLLNGTITVTFCKGTPATNTFSPSTKAATLPSVVISLSTGAWVSDTTSGTLTAPQVTALNTNQKNLKNGLENLASSLSIIIGTFVPWT